jgi:hypothetical protein
MSIRICGVAGTGGEEADLPESYPEGVAVGQ